MDFADDGQRYGLRRDGADAKTYRRTQAFTQLADVGAQIGK